MDEGDGLDSNHKFVALIRFKMCQKRQSLAGCIWRLRIFLSPGGKWCLKWGLSQHSIPARLEAVMLSIEVHHDGGKPASETGSAQALKNSGFKLGKSMLLVPEK